MLGLILFSKTKYQEHIYMYNGISHLTFDNGSLKYRLNVLK